jgi:hypothetical protein
MCYLKSREKVDDYTILPKSSIRNSHVPPKSRRFWIVRRFLTDLDLIHKSSIFPLIYLLEKFKILIVE